MFYVCCLILGFPSGSAVKNPPAMQEKQVHSLGQKDLLEGEMTTHSSILAWEIPQTEEPGSPWGLLKSQTQLSDRMVTTISTGH